MTDLRIEITEEEILADLAWPGPPPGRWPVPEPSGGLRAAGSPIAPTLGLTHRKSAVGVRERAEA